MSRWLSLAPLIVLLALGGLFGLYALNRDPQVKPQALVGKLIPDVSLPTLEGGPPVPLRLTVAAEGPVLINFFASWCAPCEVEHPALVALKAGGGRVIGVAYKDEPARTEAFLVRLGDPFALRLVDRDGRAGIEFGVTGVPESFLVGRDGVVIAKHSGPLTEAAARAMWAQATRP